MKSISPILLIAILWLTSCQNSAEESPLSTIITTDPPPITYPLTSPTPALAPELQTYLNQALDLIQVHSVYSNSADWESIQQQANFAAIGARTTADLYPVLELIMHVIGDRHGYIMPPAEAKDFFDDSAEESIPEIRSELLQGRIGSLSVPTFLSGNMNVALTFADHLQEAIRTLDAQGTCGWVIDIRSNEGGNGFAMLLGLSPLAHEGTVGWYTYTNGQTKEWVLSGNQVLLGEVPVMVLDQPEYRLNHPGAPVAIITSSATTSAGEFIAVAFRGWENTLSFGQKTLGRTTAPQGYLLEDGAILGISVAYFTDHTGQIFTGKIIPEQPIPPLHGNPNYMDYNIPQEAIDWLLSQPACTGQ